MCIGFLHNYHFVLNFEVISFTNRADMPKSNLTITNLKETPTVVSGMFSYVKLIALSIKTIPRALPLFVLQISAVYLVGRNI